LAISDVVVSAVPTASYKVKTEWLKDGCVCVNVAADKNFEADVRDKVFLIILSVGGLLTLSRGIIVHSCGWQSHHPDAAAKFVRVSFS
jgi:methylenetetrahydrofolate dehydrogenase (NAD+)